MAKKLYAKPFMVKEKFVPNEYISLCWYIDEGDCFNNLYHDTNTTTVWDWALIIPYQHDISGYFDQGEAMCENHGSHRVPAESATPKWFKADALPQPTITNDGKYYTEYTSEKYNTITGTVHPYKGAVSGNFYSYNDGTTTHYYKKPTKAGNHS